MQIFLSKDIAELQVCGKYRSSTSINDHHLKTANEVWSKVVEWISNQFIQLLREGYLSKTNMWLDFKVDTVLESLANDFYSN